MAVTIQKACIYLALILLIIVLIYIKSKMDIVEEQEGFESGDMGYLFSSTGWIQTPIPVENVATLDNGVQIYMAKQGEFVKMVSSNGDAKYFTGNISQFNPKSWNTYNDAGKNYAYKPPQVIIPKNNNLGYMYGTWIGKFIPVQDVKTLANGVKVYLSQDGQYVKMVSTTGEAKYFTGTLAQFNPAYWASYIKAGDNYKYRSSINTIPTDTVSPLIQLKNPNKNNLCMDDGGVTKAGEGKMHMWDCDQNNKNQHFIYNATLKQLKNPNKNLCVDDGGGTKPGQTAMHMWDCDPNNINQQFVYNSDTQMFVNQNKSNLCVDDGGAVDSSGKANMTLWTCDVNNKNQKFSPVPIRGPAPARTITFTKDGLINNGLKCYLDATRKDSYNPGFGSVWKDLSGGNRNFIWKDKPLFFNGKICTKGNTALGPNGDTFELGDGSNGFTIVIYSKTNAPSQSNAVLVENSQSVYGINVHLPWSDGTVYFDQGWNSGNTNGSQNRVQKSVGPCDQFSVWAFVREYSGSMKIYRDGNLLITNRPGSADKLTLKAIPWKLANNWDADISKFMVYNTYMTPDDVSNITKWIYADEAKQRDIRMAANVSKVPEYLPVKIGLQLFLDTNNYTEGSKEWRDQSGNGYDFTWSSPPKVDNMSFKLGGEYALSNKTSKELNIDGRDSYTISWIAKTNSLSANNVFKVKGNHNNKRAIFCHPTWTDSTIYFDQAGCCDAGSQRVFTSVATYYKDFAFYTLRKNSSERSIFINGKKVASAKGAAQINVNLEKMIIGRDLEDNYTWFANLRNFMVYNRDLSDDEITKLYNTFNANYEFKRLDYKGASEYCKSKGKKLCSASEYCIGGKPLYNVQDVKKWGPISDYPDGWIQLGKSGDVCKTEKQINVADREVAILCCDVKFEPLVINAIYINGAEKTFFKGKHYQTITPNSVSKVMDISKFPGLTSNFKSGNIDAIAIGNVSNTTLWFKRSHLMIYDSVKKEGREMEIRDFFKGLPDDFSSGSIDAVGTKGPNTEYVLFKKNRYCIVDLTTLKVTSSGTIADKYSSMPRDFQLGYFDCAVYSRPNCSYIMKNDKLIEYNFSTNSVVKGPVDISSIFDSLLPPFLSKDKECSVYERLMKRFPKEKYWEKMYYTSCKNISKKEYDINVENYHKIVKRYEDRYNKETGDSKRMEAEIAKYEKLLEDKKKELSSYKGKLFQLKNLPCPPDEKCPEAPKCKTKQIVVYDQGDVNAQQFYQVDKDVLKSCMK